METPSINRRDFLRGNLNNGKNERTLNDTLSPYSYPLDRKTAAHLLRRLSFAPTLQQIEFFVGKTAQEAVTILLGDPNNEYQPVNSPTWINLTTENPYGADIYTRFQIEGQWKNYHSNLQTWWVNLMIAEQNPSVEKLVHFWSNHFTTEFSYDDAYIPPQILFRQLAMFRKNRLGNFKQFVEDITLDPGMLIYLGGNLNTNRKPNENYARELMELYTTGIGHYTEGDVKEAARVLTGWKVARYNDEPARNGIYNAYFQPSDHDTEAKQFLGRSIPARDPAFNTEYLVKTEEIRTMLDILFDVRKVAIARFISAKIYKYFFYSNTSKDVTNFINECGDVLIQNDFQLYPLFYAMFSSDHFFNQQIIGAQIKSPTELICGFSKALKKSIANIPGNLSAMEEILIDPPTVQGWEAHHRWITTKTFPNRVKFSKDLVNSMTDDEVITFIKNYPAYDDAVELVNNVCLHLLPLLPTQDVLDRFTKITLLQNQPVYEWSDMIADKAPAVRGMKALLIEIAKNPAFQLC
ncbi:MAG: DUF1800 domain-containing protein [Candidatus Kapaibacteriota bacterium]